MFKELMMEESGLVFTHEEPTSGKFSFLDVAMKVQEDGTLLFSTHIKPTDKGVYTNYKSCLPDNYKLAIVKTLLHRSYRISSNWQIFHEEIERITRTLINNDFPQYFIQKTIGRFIDNIMKKKIPDANKKEKIPIYIQSFEADYMKEDQKQFQRLMTEHTSSETKKIHPSFFYRPFKLSAYFSTRKPLADVYKHHIVYEYSCNADDGCNAAYIGYSTNDLITRATQHKYKPSKIYQHSIDSHDSKPDSSIIDGFKILYINHNVNELKIAEALLIRKKKPIINIRYNENNINLYIFK